MDPWSSAQTSGSTVSFGDLLRQVRMAAALSQEELAERAGLSARGISDLERGVHRTPRLETIRMVADALALGDTDRAALIMAARLSSRGPPSTRAPQTSLPVPPTRLIGRERELALANRSVRDDGVRLLSITGPGGSGKTRLAIAVGHSLAARFLDGTIFVDLAPLAHDQLVPAAVAQAFGLRDLGGREPVDVLSSLLAGKRVLLILDNFEHLLDAAPFVAALLAASPSLTVLATSREPLRLRGEREILVPPLGLPAPGRSGAPIDLARSEAVALFVERARDARADFALTDTNAADVAAICRRLDGLPLALELAAAHIRMLPPRALLRRLEEPLAVLTAGKRDAPARQRTLRDTIAWSHKLLTADEQRLFQALGVFVGGWTLDAAEAVANPPDNLNVFAGIASLVEKNLVRMSEDSGEPRYAMLETVREYAAEQLAASGNANELRERHAAWCLALAEVAEQALEGYGGEQARWLARMDTELGNVRAALAWLHTSGDARRLLRLAAVLDVYWAVRPYAAEIVHWLEIGLRETDVPVKIRAAGIDLAASLTNLLGDHRRAVAYAQEGLALAESWGDLFDRGRAHYTLGGVWEHVGDVAQAAASFAEAVAWLRQAGAASWVYLALADLGSMRLLSGDLAGALPLLDEALALVRARDEADPLALQDRYGLSQVLAIRAYAERAAGDERTAAHLFAESLDIGQELGAQRVALGALAGLAGLALDRNQAKRSARLLSVVNDVREAWGVKRVQHFLHAERVAEATRAALSPEEFAAAWSEGCAMPYAQAVADVLALVEETLEAPQ